LWADGILIPHLLTRNQHFKPIKPDDEIKKMIDEPKKKLLQAQELLSSLGNADANVNSVKKILLPH
jgi:hypothetical protein